MRIGSDVNRFKDILKSKVRDNLGKYIGSDELVSQNADGKTFKIPIKSIDLPRFMYSSGSGGGSSMGDGDVGDPISGSGKKGEGSGKAGNEAGDHNNDAEFTPDELAQILGEALQLPNVSEKSKGKVVSTSTKYNSIAPNGVIKHFKRTYKEALKRSISSGTYNPNDPMVIPIKPDRRYKYGAPITNPSVNTVIFYIMDISGSMEDKQKQIVKSEVFWIDLWLSHQYKGIESRFIVHDTKAEEVSRDDFFLISEAGGTQISSALLLYNDLQKQFYPFSEWNIYPFYFSDGDNWSDSDNVLCMELLKEQILPNCNQFSYGQTTSAGGSGEFLRFLDVNFDDTSANIKWSKIDSRDDIMNSIKDFLGKGK